MVAERWLLLFGLTFFVTGYFGPWVGHENEAVALTVTGLELAEFAKFFPQVQGRTVPVTRELFYLPLVASLVLLVLLIGRSTVRPVRLIAPLFAAALLLVALLPYSTVNSARQALTTHSPFTLDPQYRGQLVLVFVGMVLTLLAPLARRLPRSLQSILVVFLALAGSLPTLWQFALLRPLVVALYDAPVGLGWGLIVCTLGFVLLLAHGVLSTVRSARG